jgi:hypothetical protein
MCAAQEKHPHLCGTAEEDSDVDLNAVGRPVRRARLFDVAGRTVARSSESSGHYTFAIRR